MIKNINKEKIIARIDDVKEAMVELEKYYGMDLDSFLSEKDNFHLASHWLRIAIESVLTIGTHILARIPSNGKKKDYTQIILSLGEYEIIPDDFAKKIKGMAGYRNRLVHVYWEITPEELYNIIKENLNDFDVFVKHILKSIE